MIRSVIALFAAVLALPALFFPGAAHAQGEEQSLVDRATLTVQEMLNAQQGANIQSLLTRARAVMVCPRIFRAGFIIGGSGGGCVLVGRDGAGSWSSPAFYGIGSGSVGLQIGVQDAEMVMTIMTERGLQAILDSQFKFGADAGVSIATIGAGVEGSTTAALDADVVAFAQSRGLFAGVSLQGTVMAIRSESIRNYYGRDYSARQLVIEMAANNPGAGPLREILTRYGARAVAPPANMTQSPGYAPAQPPVAGGQLVAPPPNAPVQSQSLPPPRR